MAGGDQFGGAVDKLKDKAREFLGSQEEGTEEEQQDAQGAQEEAEQKGQDLKERAEQEADELRDRF